MRCYDNSRNENGYFWNIYLLGETHAILGLFNIAWGKTHSRTSETVTKKSPAFTTAGGKKKKVHFPIQLHTSECSTEFSRELEASWTLLSSGRTECSNLSHHRLGTGPANNAKRPRNCEITLDTVTNKREKYQWLTKILWDLLLEFTIQMRSAFPDSTTVSLHLMQSIGSVTWSKMTPHQISFTTGWQISKS